MTHISRKQLEAQAWKRTHRDFKGGRGEARSLLVPRSGGSCLVPLSEATDAELLAKLPPVEREQARTGRIYALGQPVAVAVGQRVLYNGREVGEVVEVYRSIVYVRLESGSIVSAGATFPGVIPE